MKLNKENLVLYAITDRGYSSMNTLYYKVEKALQGNISMLQLREKDITEEEYIKKAIYIRKLCDKYKVPLIINDNPYVAIKSKAQGVHIGKNDLSIEQTRKIIGKNLILGVTAKTVEDAIYAEQNGADYLGVGAIFPSSTKIEAKITKIETLKEITKNVNIPVVAIGGITSKNITALKGCNINGVAVVSDIFSAKNIKEKCIRLRSLSMEVVNE